ncbi:hypothetical protein FI667_g6027, partial [Globisporangium splendens]
MTQFEEAALHSQQPRFVLIVRALIPQDEQLHDASVTANRKRKAAVFRDDDRQSHERWWTQLLDAIQVLHLLLQSADEEFVMMTPDARENLLQFLHEDIEVVVHVGWNVCVVKRKDNPVDALLRTFNRRTTEDAITTQCDSGVGFVLGFSGCKQIPEIAMDSLRDVLQRRDANALYQTSSASLQKLLQASRYDQQHPAPVRLGLRFWNCAVSLQTLTMLRSCVSGFDSSLQLVSGNKSSSTNVNKWTPAFQLKMLDLSENVLGDELLDNAARLIQSVHTDALSLNGISNGLIANEAREAFLCAILMPHEDPLTRGKFVYLAPAPAIGTLLHVGASRFRETLPSNWSLSLSSLLPVLSIDRDVLWPWLAFGIFRSLARSGVTELDLSYNRFDEHDVEVFARVVASLQPPQRVWYDEPFLFDKGEEEEKVDDGQNAEENNETVAEWICLAAATEYAQDREKMPLHWRSYWQEWVCIVVPGHDYEWVRTSSITTKVHEVGPVDSSARVTSLIMDWHHATTPRGDPDRIQVVKQLLKHIGSPLKSLRLRSSTLTTADVHEPLALCPRLQHLDIESCVHRDIASPMDRANSAFLKLQSVNLRHNPLTSEDRETLAEVDTKFGISSTIWYFSE